MTGRIRLAADENFNAGIVRGVFRLLSTVDFLSIQDAGLAGASDEAVLEWAAREGRVLLTHDFATMPKAAYDRIREGKPMPGVFQVASTLPVGRVIEDIVLLVECSQEGEWEGQVRYLPL